MSMKNRIDQGKSVNAGNTTRSLPVEFPSEAPAAEEVPFRFRRLSDNCARKVRALKDRIVRELGREFAGVLNPETVRHVVNEADSLAALTPFPALFLPVLAEEKVRGA